MRRTFILLVALLMRSGCADAATNVFIEKATFLSSTQPNTVASFDDVDPGTVAPFSSNGVAITGVGGNTPTVINGAVGLGHSFWFSGEASPPNFLDTQPRFQATFPTDVTAAGFDFMCFACGLAPVNWKLLSATGDVVDSGSTPLYDYTVHSPFFFGVVSDAQFRSIVVDRLFEGGEGNWFADDVRYATSLAIDIKPGQEPNNINPRSNGVIPVAVLGTSHFDAATLDPSSIRFGRTGTQARGLRYELRDVNGDGRIDILVYFETQATGIACGHTRGILTGTTMDGHAVGGVDSIRTTGCQ